MFNEEQFRLLFVRRALEFLQIWTAESEELLILTCAQESLGGTYVKQTNGDAAGVYQMERATYDYLWATWLPKHSHYAYKALQSVYMQTKPPFEMMMDNIYYATIMARLNYLRFADPIPAAHDVKGLAEYYKKFWNTSAGASTVPQAIMNYTKFMGITPKLKVKKG